MNCILPSAVTPMQKTICVTVAVVGLSLVSFVGYKTYEYTKIFENGDLILSKIRDKIPNKFKLNDEQMNKIFNTTPQNLNVWIGIGGCLGLVGGWGLFRSTKDTYLTIARTNQCCNIMRNTIVYSLCAPVFLLSLLFGGIIVKLAYHDKNLLSICEFKNNINKC